MKLSRITSNYRGRRWAHRQSSNLNNVFWRLVSLCAEFSVAFDSGPKSRTSLRFFGLKTYQNHDESITLTILSVGASNSMKGNLLSASQKAFCFVLLHSPHPPWFWMVLLDLSRLINLPIRSNVASLFPVLFQAAIFWTSLALLILPITWIHADQLPLSLKLNYGAVKSNMQITARFYSAPCAVKVNIKFAARFCSALWR